jgi:hypothetical protein
MWYQRLLSKRLGVAISGVVAVISSGVSPLEMTIAITSIVCTYVVAETSRPSGSIEGSNG